MKIDEDNLNNIGTILYEEADGNNLIIFEVDSLFKLRKAKIKHKGWFQSNIFSPENNKYSIYIEELGKWYYNKELFQDKDIQVELHDSINDIIIDSEDKTGEDIEVLPENIIFYEYIKYNIINFNYITAKGYKSRLLLENELDSERKSHISKIYKHEQHDNVYYIKVLDKWYYNSKDYYSKFIDIKLYDSFEEMPIEKLIQDNQLYLNVTLDENKESRRSDINRLNVNAIHKDLSKLGYMLLEFTSINHIKYQIFETIEEAEELFTYNNQVTKCYYKRNDENIVYIKSLNRWINKQEETAKLYESDIDVPLNQEQKVVISHIDPEISLKKIAKNRKLIPSGWIYYEIIDDNYIIARHYNSSNKLLGRLNEKGNDSQYFKAKKDNVCYIQKLNKWYYYTERLEKEDMKIKIYDEKEIYME